MLVWTTLDRAQNDCDPALLTLAGRRWWSPRRGGLGTNGETSRGEREIPGGIRLVRSAISGLHEVGPGTPASEQCLMVRVGRGAAGIAYFLMYRYRYRVPWIMQQISEPITNLDRLSLVRRSFHSRYIMPGKNSTFHYKGQYCSGNSPIWTTLRQLPGTLDWPVHASLLNCSLQNIIDLQHELEAQAEVVSLIEEQIKILESFQKEAPPQHREVWVEQFRLCGRVVINCDNSSKSRVPCSGVLASSSSAIVLLWRQSAVML